MARRYKPVLITVDPDIWEQFVALVGKGKASKHLRMMVRTEVRMAKAIDRVKV